MVAALVKPGAEIAATMTPLEADLLHGAVGVSGEVAELLYAVMCVAVGCLPLDRANMVEELGDLEFYLEQVRSNRQIERDVSMLEEPSESFDPNALLLESAALSVGVGTLLDLAKKVVIYKRDVSAFQFRDAFMWIEKRMNAIRTLTGITREETLEANIAKLSVRYAGLTYSDEAAQVRADKAGE